MIVGGAQENTLLSVIRHWENGHQPVLVTGPSPGPEGELLTHAELPPVEIITLPELVREINPWRDWRATRALERLFRERDFDVVHTHSSKAGVLGRAAAWRAKVPFIAHTVHGQAFHPYEKAWKNRLYIAAERNAARHCHQIYAVAQAMIDQCVAAGVAPREKYRVVYSGMRLEKFHDAQPDPALRAALGIPENAPVIGTLARLFPLKGYEYVLPAARELIQAGSPVHFLIIGDGSLRGELEAKLRADGIGERFHFAGLIAPDEVGHYLANIDLLWHLSLREGLPRSVVQALATGKPAIGFRLDGTPEVLIDGETGWCVAPGDVGAVVRHSTELLADPTSARRLGANGQKMTAERFDWENMGDLLEADYVAHLTASGRI